MVSSTPSSTDRLLLRRSAATAFPVAELLLDGGLGGVLCVGSFGAGGSSFTGMSSKSGAVFGESNPSNARVRVPSARGSRQISTVGETKIMM